jgi:dihydroorotate dehydrogenase
VRSHHDRFATAGLPSDLDSFLLEEYGLDMSASYAGLPLKNPWGKASGQLSLNRSQVQEAIDAGLGLVVLKTVIAQDASGQQTMAAWAIKESKMVAEPIVSPATGDPGWTISWKGRGWWQSFEDYLSLVREATALGQAAGLLVVPSVKYHLPAPGESAWRVEEYRETTRALLRAFEDGGGEGRLPIEKDFSPTLAGSERSAQRAKIVEWLRVVPNLIRSQAPHRLLVGLKLFNSLDDDAFQLAMLAEVFRADGPDFLIYANRLFDPDREFEGHRGIAYGGPALSERNLRLLSMLRLAQQDGSIPSLPREISATGDIRSGRIAVEYLLRGCSSFQIHTLFQLPAEAYAMRVGSKVQKALHLLYFDPDEGFIVWAWHAARRLGQISESGGRSQVRLLDLARTGAKTSLSAADLDSERL